LRQGHEGWWLETAGNGEQEALKQILSSEYVYYARASVSLRYLLYQEPSGELWRMSVPEGKRERLPAIFDQTNPFALGIQMSFDDKSVVYEKSRTDARLVLIENLFE
jgi:hypothetical protein